MTYDCTEDVMKHKGKVEYWLRRFWTQLENRAPIHDDSKLKDPTEKTMFDYWTPELKQRTFGTDYYKDALDGMGEGLKLHYEANRHHPEHFENGVNDMTLIDVIEMVADWMAAAEAKNVHIDLDHAAERFGLSEQLVKIIANQLREEDLYNAADNIPVPAFCPPDRRRGYVDGFELVNEP
jgi:hypothetical protein